MIDTIFHTIGIIGHIQCPKAIKTYFTLYHWLHQQGFKIMIEQHIAHLFHKNNDIIIGNLNDIGDHADLAIIIGGDGNMLRAVNILAQYNIKIIGINLGTLGFLTDLHPNSALTELTEILSGNFINEKRFLLDVNVKYHKNLTKLGTVVNEVIVHANTIGHMVVFDLYINDNFSFSIRSDGLIIATPTGSTAYSLSAGGPILIPTVNAVVLVPICPHTLSSRPIILDNKNVISLKFSKITPKLKISCDNQAPVLIHKEKEIFIQRSNYSVNLIHPNNYNYFKNLNIKLGWLKTFNSIQNNS